MKKGRRSASPDHVSGSDRCLVRSDPTAKRDRLFGVRRDDRDEHPALGAFTEFNLAGFGGEDGVIAAEADISKRRFEQAVRYKRFERYVPSKDAMENYKKIGGDNNGAARVLYIRQAVSSKPQYTPLND